MTFAAKRGAYLHFFHYIGKLFWFQAITQTEVYQSESWELSVLAGLFWVLLLFYTTRIECKHGKKVPATPFYVLLLPWVSEKQGLRLFFLFFFCSRKASHKDAAILDSQYTLLAVAFF
ncbi:LOW QUALITY PROTEIN: hypothetical protein M8C21_004998 [Ambrosia artemisiifolia]|uniref:Uncharacterized protein n=1 Tax=Ambrosia artemisiifolia TaxID=4212 RepID=A0AAD5CM58_AMBAR|nr:LOW QUALITY PROTEIN: hypothetical protein M8C21_004998 [Ambrosia artemisiifolia]